MSFTAYFPDGRRAYRGTDETRARRYLASGFIVYVDGQEWKG